MLNVYCVWITIGGLFIAYCLKKNEQGKLHIISSLFKQRPILSIFLLFVLSHVFPIFMYKRCKNSNE